MKWCAGVYINRVPAERLTVEAALRYTGMRAGELVSLTRDQVNLNRRIVKLSETKNGSARTVPLSIEATEAFRAALDNPIRPIDTSLIFFGEHGKDGKRRPYCFNKLWANLLKELNISDLHFHDLRHEAVSRLVEAGLGDSKVAAISGYKSMQMLKRLRTCVPRIWFKSLMG